MNNFSRDIELEKRIEAYINGELSEEEADRLWVDLLEKPEYLDLLETELGAREVHRRKGNPGNKVSETMRLYKGWITAAASIVLIAVAVLSQVPFNSGRATSGLALKSINAAEHLATPEIVRGHAQGPENGSRVADSLLKTGFKAALNEDAGQALLLYERVAVEYRKSGNAAAMAYLNIGILRYNREEFGASAGAFGKAAQSMVDNDPILKAKALWFLGHSYLRLGKRGEAREAFQKVYGLGGMFKQQAGALLAQLD